MADDLLEIADKASTETVNPARLQVDARKWLLARCLPKLYGDKLEHAGEIKTTSDTASPGDVARAVMAIFNSAKLEEKEQS